MLITVNVWSNVRVYRIIVIKSHGKSWRVVTLFYPGKLECFLAKSYVLSNSAAYLSAAPNLSLQVPNIKLGYMLLLWGCASVAQRWNTWHFLKVEGLIPSPEGVREKMVLQFLAEKRSSLLIKFKNYMK